ncbi:MAG: hypothetical protein ACF8QF_13590 [Phycisphaerales bacterium]
MGFDTSVLLYTPTNPPPKVTTGDLAGFVRAVDATGVLTEGRRALKVIFGKRIDKDSRGVVEHHGVLGLPGMFRVSTRTSDIEADDLPSLAALASKLDEHGATIYRAFLRLGLLNESTYARLKERIGGAESVAPDAVSFELGPIQVGDLGSDADALVGWMGMSFYAPGLSAPSGDYRTVVDVIRTDPDLVDLAVCVSDHWRLPPVRLKRSLARGRERLGALWPYDTVDITDPWVWGVSVS